MESAIEEYPVRKAKTVRFTCGAPRSPKLIGDGSRMLFLRSAGEQDTENSLWLAICGEDAYAEVELVNAGELVNTLGSDDVPAAERARRERARESATGIVAYSVDGLGNHVAFTVNGELFVTTIDWDALAYTVGDDGVRAQVGAGVRTEHLVPQFADSAQNEFAGPVLNPRMSPDGKRVAYATGSAVVVVDVQTAVANAVFTVSPQDRETMRAGLAEFAAGEEMDRYDGFWWGPDSRTLLVECFDSSPEPVWTISDPADPAARGIQHRYPRALTENAVVDLFAVRLGDDGTSVQKTAMIDWDNVAYEYLAVVDWQAERPVLRVLDRLQQHEQILRVAMPAENEWGDLRALDGNVMALLPVEVIAEHHNDQWIDLVGGTPCVTPSGAVVCSVNDMEADTNRLSVDGRVFTPAGWQVREVLDAGTDDVLCVVQRTAERAAEVPEQLADSTAERYHDARSFDIVTISYADGSVRAVSDEPGVWRASRRGDGLVVWGRTMDSAKAVMPLAQQRGGDQLERRVLRARHGDVAGQRVVALYDDDLFSHGSILRARDDEGPGVGFIGWRTPSEAPFAVPTIIRTGRLRAHHHHNESRRADSCWYRNEERRLAQQDSEKPPRADSRLVSRLSVLRYAKASEKGLRIGARGLRSVERFRRPSGRRNAAIHQARSA